MGSRSKYGRPSKDKKRVQLTSQCPMVCLIGWQCNVASYAYLWFGPPPAEFFGLTGDVTREKLAPFLISVASDKKKKERKKTKVFGVAIKKVTNTWVFGKATDFTLSHLCTKCLPQKTRLQITEPLYFVTRHPESRPMLVLLSITTGQDPNHLKASLSCRPHRKRNTEIGCQKFHENNWKTSISVEIKFEAKGKKQQKYSLLHWARL